MPEEITDSERSELQAETRDTKKKKKEMSIDEIMSCPTWDCDGGPEIVKVLDYENGDELWMVWCPKCKGWMSYFITAGDPYGEGTKIWTEMRTNMEK